MKDKGWFLIRYRVEERIGRAEPSIKHCNRAGKRHGFETGVMHSAVKFLVRLDGGHQLKKLPGETAVREA